MLSVAEKSRRRFLEETPLGRTRRARKIHRILADTYPTAHAELDHRDAFELLVATVLSAQTTDVRVNSVTPALFAAYPDAGALAAATREDVEEIIRPTGFYRAKARSIVGLAQSLVDEFGGEVPNSLEQLVTLPGVGRKTANVVLGNVFDVPGLTIDTHFARLAQRFLWTDSDTADRIEKDVAALFPRKDWTMLSHRVIWHGRRICHARTPACGACPISALCPAFGTGELDERKARKLLRFELAEDAGAGGKTDGGSRVDLGRAHGSTKADGPARTDAPTRADGSVSGNARTNEEDTR